jgi:uncharacterized protein
MKYLLLLLGVGLVVWQWRKHRSQQHLSKKPDSSAVPPPAASTIDMVRCSHCGVHVPATDAVHGQRGAYCTEAHRRTAEG